MTTESQTLEPGITVVVTTHDSAKTIDACLASIIGAPHVREVLVVDSGSRDGTPASLPSRHPGVRVIELGANLGPCATRNRGLAEARTTRVLFVDDDMVLEQGVVERLLGMLDGDPGSAMVGPAIVHADRPDSVQYAGGLAHFGGLPHLIGLGKPPERSREPYAVDVLTAGCLLVDTARLREAGGFDETYFFLAEDVDLSLRMRQRGWRLWVVPAAVACNVGGSAGMSLKHAVYPARRVELHSRNRWLLIAKLYDCRTIFVLLPALVIFEIAWFGFAVLAGQSLAYVRGKVSAVGLLLRRAHRRGPLYAKKVRDRALLGAPSMSFTGAALAQPLARAGSVMLDGWMKMLWAILRGGLA